MAKLFNTLEIPFSVCSRTAPQGQTTMETPGRRRRSSHYFPMATTKTRQAVKERLVIMVYYCVKKWDEKNIDQSK